MPPTSAHLNGSVNLPDAETVMRQILGRMPRGRRLHAEGLVPPGVRFQAEYPTPLASIASFIAPEDRAAVEPSYERALFADNPCRKARLNPRVVDEAKRLERRLDQSTIRPGDDEVEVGVGPSLHADQRVDSPAAVDPDRDAP